MSVGKRLTPTTACKPEPVDDPDVAGEVPGADLDRVRATVRVAGVMLERAHRRDENDRIGSQVADAAGDVEELLHPHVRREPGLRDDVVAELERDPVGDEGVVAVCDVREGTAVDERGLALQRLDEVRLDRLLEHDRERTCGAELLRGHRLAVVRLADGDLPEPLAQVGEVARHRDHGHDLARRGDVEAGLPRVAVRLAPEAGDDVPQRAVVHVQAAPPGDRDRIEAEERSRA